MQRQGIGQAADMAGDHRYRAEFAHGAGSAQHHAIQQTPLDIRQGDAPEGAPAAGTEHQGSFLLLGALSLHQRNQLAGNERHGNKHRGQDNAGHGENDPDAMLIQPRSQPALGAEQQHINQPGDHRRHCER